MKKVALFFLLLFIVGCGSNKNSSNTPSDIKSKLDRKNSGNISLLTRIRQKPGIILKNGVPALQKAENRIASGAQQPLYILNDLIIGNSFKAVDDLIDNFMVKKIEILSGSQAAFYGSRAANGVIKITTLSAEDTSVGN